MSWWGVHSFSSHAHYLKRRISTGYRVVDPFASWTKQKYWILSYPIFVSLCTKIMTANKPYSALPLLHEVASYWVKWCIRCIRLGGDMYRYLLFPHWVALAIQYFFWTFRSNFQPSIKGVEFAGGFDLFTGLVFSTTQRVLKPNTLVSEYSRSGISESTLFDIGTLCVKGKSSE